MALFGRPTARDESRANAYRDWLRRRNPLAVASLVLGTFSLIEFGTTVVFGLAGIVLGVVALRQLRRAACPQPTGAAPTLPGHEPDDSPAAPTEGQRLAWAGIVASVASLVIALVLYHPWRR